ncbi:MAG: serine racemase VanT catalytic subunit [Roseburia sp.]|nr:serine racemase VanT catalytic subunit [Roseburia sp.]MCM1242766.1 serine racemase VanT catalytic subunit [Roseburia sp.]
MCKKEQYPGIDIFRLPAALLVIAIHTSPLASYNETADFILTRSIARIAVPFFLMISGFFVLSASARNSWKYHRYIRKTVYIYLISILFYLPLNIYNGYFRMNNLLPNLLKDIVFDGTLYHLWYLPAALSGAYIARYLLNRFHCGQALAISFMLYGIGLFGDSYYGISENIPVLKSFYALLFQVMDYTRNGLFFAPLFFIIGARMADCCRLTPEESKENGLCMAVMLKNICRLALTLSLMSGEALLLRYYHVQRHDSMYLFLPLCTYFLFRLLLSCSGYRFKKNYGKKYFFNEYFFREKSSAWLRTYTLTIYIVHPMMIVLVRLLAKVLHLEYLFIENSLLHYLSVCILSLLCGLILCVLQQKGHRLYRHKPIEHVPDRAYVEIDLQNLEHNAKVLQKAMSPDTRLMAVVKANAYGHGSIAIAKCLNHLGTEAFAVAAIEEGIALRKHGIRGEILILGYTAPERAAELKRYDLTQTLIDLTYAQTLNRQNIKVKAHLKIDTGMHRLGVPTEDVLSIQKIFAMKNIFVCGIYTHLCCADSLLPDDISFTRRQIERFYSLIHKLEKAGIKIPKLHIQSSYGLLNYPDLKCDYVRCGIALYGILCKPHDETVLHLDLRPVLSFKSIVVLIRLLEKGESVGYGRSFVTSRKSRLAILPVGYADGFPRSLSCSVGNVLIRGQKAPVVGRVCMDQLAVDVTDIEGVSIGDIATLIGADGRTALSAPEVAERLDSISNELLCRIGERVSREY